MIYDKDGNLVYTYKVIGIGEFGCAVINNMVSKSISGFEFIAMNSDAEKLNKSLASVKIHIGSKVEKKLNNASNSDLSTQSLLDTLNILERHLKNTNMAILIAEFGKNTDIDVLSAVAQIANELGVLTIGVILRPLCFEKKCYSKAYLEMLNKQLDTCFIVESSKIVSQKSFDEIQQNVINVFTDIVYSMCYEVGPNSLPGADFLDVIALYSNNELGTIYIGEAEGVDREIIAIERALDNPITQIIPFSEVNVICYAIFIGMDFRIEEIENIALKIYDVVEDNCDTFSNILIDPKMKGEIRVTVFAMHQFRYAD